MNVHLADVRREAQPLECSDALFDDRQIHIGTGDAEAKRVIGGDAGDLAVCAGDELSIQAHEELQVRQRYPLDAGVGERDGPVRFVDPGPLVELELAERQRVTQHVKGHRAIGAEVDQGRKIAQAGAVQGGLRRAQVHARVGERAPVQLGHWRYAVTVCGLVQQGIHIVGVERQLVINAHQVAAEVVQRHRQVAAVVGLEGRIGAAVLEAHERQLAYRRAEAQRAVGHRVVAVVAIAAHIGKASTHAHEHTHIAQGQNHGVGIFQRSARQCRTSDLPQCDAEVALGHQHTGQNIERHPARHRQVHTGRQRAQAGAVQGGLRRSQIHARGSERAPVQFGDRRDTVTVCSLVQQGIDVVGVEHQQVVQTDQVAIEIVQRNRQVAAVVGLDSRIGAAVLDAHQGQLAHRCAKAQRAIHHRVVGKAGRAVGVECTANPDKHTHVVQYKHHRVGVFRCPTGQRCTAHLAQSDAEVAFGHQHTSENIERHPTRHRQVHTARQRTQAGAVQCRLGRAQIHAG